VVVIGYSSFSFHYSSTIMSITKTKQSKPQSIGSTLKVRPSNVILYEGSSLIDGSPIVVILTGLSQASSNAKTGDADNQMLQTWILRGDNVNPIEASRLGLDRGICGDCPHKGTPNLTKATGWADNRSCYVNLLFAPSAIYKSYKRGSYKRITRDQISAVGKGQSIRLGSFGDPAACPQFIWDELLKHSVSHTGYSHASGSKGSDGKSIKVDPALMVSADSRASAHAYQSLYQRRTFRVIDVKTWEQQGKKALLKTEVLCPASTEGFREGVTCSTCGLCNGVIVDNQHKNNAQSNGGATQVTMRKSIAIVAHGTSKASFKG